MDNEPVEMPLDYLQGHKDGLEWASQLAEANHPETGDWLYDDPIELAKAIRKGSDMPPAQPAADSEPVAWTWQHLKQWHVTNDEERARDLAWDGVKVEPLYRRAAMLQAGTLTNEGTKQAWTGILISITPSTCSTASIHWIVAMMTVLRLLRPFCADWLATLRCGLA